MAKIFYCGAKSDRLGMLRAIISAGDLFNVFSDELPKYVGKSFPNMEQADAPCTLIEVLPEEGQGNWQAGFYRAAKGPLEFENHLRVAVASI